MPVPQRVIFLMGFYPVSNRHDACSTKSYFFLWGYILLATGKMPVPQRVIFFLWGYILSATGKMPVPQKVIFFWVGRHYQNNFFPKRGAGGVCGVSLKS